jgi:chromosome segregation ATPase
MAEESSKESSNESSKVRRLKERLETLREEFNQGQSQLIQAETRVRELRETLLRISGAIQVLSEEFGES